MAITEPFELDGVTIGATEWSVTTNSAGPDLNTTAGVYQLWVDATAMLKADEFAVRAYEKVEGTGGAQKLFLKMVLSDVQSEIFVTPTFILMNGWDFTLQKVAGTDRVIDASVRKVA